MALIRHLIKVPELPFEVRDQDNGVHILEYLTAEGDTIDRGESLVRIETWWAILELQSNIKAWVSKNLYDEPMFRGSLVKVGELLSLAYSDVDDLTGVSEPYFQLRVVKTLRVKPPRRSSR